ncbi:hypothetical protein F2P81_026293 [Scophthalmus maximus]|uniref:Uncharacterized protein n=1 Tax=Scophthalmus maximus TaxID=52904 RepID=A0A6A4RS54_SCOMX|nr:hypothetical protein F2P81_026293 [Scophthalmus maximus]
MRSFSRYHKRRENPFGGGKKGDRLNLELIIIKSDVRGRRVAFSERQRIIELDECIVFYHVIQFSPDRRTF